MVRQQTPGGLALIVLASVLPQHPPAGGVCGLSMACITLGPNTGDLHAAADRPGQVALVRHAAARIVVQHHVAVHV